jgi:hypothetical protein
MFQDLKDFASSESVVPGWLQEICTRSLIKTPKSVTDQVPYIKGIVLVYVQPPV